MNPHLLIWIQEQVSKPERRPSHYTTRQIRKLTGWEARAVRELFKAKGCYAARRIPIDSLERVFDGGFWRAVEYRLRASMKAGKAA